MSEDRARSLSISIFDSDLNRVNQFAKDNQKKLKLRSNADVWRHIINFFFDQHRSDLKKDMVIHFVYPVAFGCLASFGTLSTEKLISILFEKGFYFRELHVLNGIFVVLGAFSIGLFIANLYWLVRKYR